MEIRIINGQELEKSIRICDAFQYTKAAKESCESYSHQTKSTVFNIQIQFQDFQFFL